MGGEESDEMNTLSSYAVFQALFSFVLHCCMGRRRSYACMGCVGYEIL